VIPTSGEGGIRTPDAGITDITVFETAAFNRSAPSKCYNTQILDYRMSPTKSPVCKTFATLQLKFRITSGVTLAS
jgi:hypothetical protein